MYKFGVILSRILFCIKYIFMTAKYIPFMMSIKKTLFFYFLFIIIYSVYLTLERKRI